MTHIDSKAREAIKKMAEVLTAEGELRGNYAAYVKDILDTSPENPKTGTGGELKWGCRLEKNPYGANLCSPSGYMLTGRDGEQQRWSKYSGQCYSIDGALAALNACETPPPDCVAPTPTPPPEGERVREPRVRCFRHYKCKTGFEDCDRVRFVGDRSWRVFADGSDSAPSDISIALAERHAQEGIWIEVPDSPLSEPQQPEAKGGGRDFEGLAKAHDGNQNRVNRLMDQAEPIRLDTSELETLRYNLCCDGWDASVVARLFKTIDTILADRDTARAQLEAASKPKPDEGLNEILRQLLGAVDTVVSNSVEPYEQNRIRGRLHTAMREVFARASAPPTQTAAQDIPEDYLPNGAAAPEQAYVDINGPVTVGVFQINIAKAVQWVRGRDAIWRSDLRSKLRAQPTPADREGRVAPGA